MRYCDLMSTLEFIYVFEGRIMSLMLNYASDVTGRKMKSHLHDDDFKFTFEWNVSGNIKLNLNTYTYVSDTYISFYMECVSQYSKIK